MRRPEVGNRMAGLTLTLDGRLYTHQKSVNERGTEFLELKKVLLGS